ncbi:MAG: hypothetical protein KIS61_00430 [Candidatus Eremiobacteraeota bacterium]|nr:hypothetical protein [Candidatus Eremiobacteraeota bacterium]
MKFLLWCSLASLASAVPCRPGSHCHYSGGGYYGSGGVYGYGRRARGPELPKVGGTLPGYDNEEARRFPDLNRRQPAGSLGPFTPTPFDPSRMGQAGNTFRINHSVAKAPPGY